MFDLLSRLPRLPALPLRPQRMAQALLSAPVAAMSRSLAAHRAWPGAVVGQLIDLALLAGGMLKGESLNKFIRRSVEMIEK